MKHICTITMLLCFYMGFSQDSKQDFKQDWKEVIQFELDGKVKSASDAVNVIYKKAKRKKIDDEIIKCFFYQSKFLNVKEEDAHQLILKNLAQEIKDAKGTRKALLNFIYVSILEKFYQGYSYNINQRTNLKQNDSKDFLTWTSQDFTKEIDKVYSHLLDDEKELRKVNINTYASIFEISPYTDTKKMSIYDFLLSEILRKEFKNLYIDNKRQAKTMPELFKTTAEFVEFKTDTITTYGSLKRIIELYQHNEKYCLKNNNEDIHLLQYIRMKSFAPYFTDKTEYFKRVTELEKATTNPYLLQDIRIDIAQYYYNSTGKGSERNYYPEALTLIETVLNANENPNAKVQAEDLKEDILGKKLVLNIPKQLYQNQNYKAFVEYKNVDTIKVSYYKIPVELIKTMEKHQRFDRDYKQLDRDSLLFNYMEKHQAFKTMMKVLPEKTDHFDYSTEILMENLDLGSYLLFFEIKNPLGYPNKKTYAYHMIQVSNIDFVNERDEEKNHDVFQLLDRQTGKPIENATVKNDDATQLSSKTGRVNFTGASDYYEERFSDLLFIKEKDTLYSNYYKSTTRERNDNERFEAKSMIFFDRAIYRPGQKVFYKGFIFKRKDKVKSVVPFLTVHLTITDADDNDVVELDVQTNEFGSFTGEYEIPKNILPGEFHITIDEPDDNKVDTQYYDKEEGEHSFWDNADYRDNAEFKFKVEEYKRPTFEITFDKIKENYTIGDSVTVHGNAKTLAGSNLTNAKVKYDVSHSVRGKYNYYNNENRDDEDEDALNSETTTDENGNFKIEFVSKPNEDEIPANETEAIFYTIKVAITDVNGETRTSEYSITVGKEMLKLNAEIQSVIFREDKNSFKISATTLNNFPINTKGTITFVELNQKEYLIKKQRFPELFAIGRTEFEALFPYEPYDKTDIEVHENKVLTIPFDTEKASLIDLSFVKGFKLGNYKIVLEAKDEKGNLITDSTNFEFTSKTKKASNETLFNFNQLAETKDYFVFEINSVIPDLYVTTRVFDNVDKTAEVLIQLKNGSGLVKIPKKKEYPNGIQFLFSSLWKGIYYDTNLKISSEEIEAKLEFEIQSMRNKVEPGSNEKWSFIVKNSKMQSEVLASMYDTSLDQFATEDWSVENFRRYYTPTGYVGHATDSWYENRIYFENLYFNSKYYKTFIQSPKLEWFGFDFNNRQSYLNTQYLKKVAPIATIPHNAKTVFGVVSDKSGPIPGANVMVRGTTRATQTNFDGYYEIEVQKGETLEFNFVGYSSTTIVIEKIRNLDIQLKEQSVSLEEVVITGYGFTTKKAKSVSAAMTTVTRDESAKSILDLLSGTVAGVDISMASGSSTQLIIRGMSSVNTATEPLFVVDGVPMSQAEFKKMNPTDIQDYSILKDATAIYGSRAGNGVIIISTKKGMQELEQVKTRTNFNETAFFYPNLTTDAQGRISFSFTTPESLTKWKLRLFAHNKKAETGYLQSEIVSQKDIMVMPNMPRFLREKDTINLAVKVVNLTDQLKSGNAILLLYDAATNNPIDAITMNKNNTKVFSCKPKQSVVVNWKITIPEGVQGLRYKVIAKSGNLSDGEENILPVLTNRVLVTESIPIWVKGNTKREFTIENLKNNTSTTLQHHALTFEYTSNPVWLALQSLPYLMTYEYDCAEQLFAKYYANYIAEKIITSNPKVASLFKKWENSKFPESKLKLNDELKSTVLAETPWLMDAESEEENNKRLALLLNLNTLKENNETILKKVEERLLPSGGFAWFSGGYENRYITQHILSEIGHLNTLFPSDSLKYKTIVSKSLPNMDNTFVSIYTSKYKYIRPSTVNMNYLYTRSYYLKSFPLSKKCDSLVRLQINHCKEDWLSYSLYEKGLLALIMNRFNEKDFAKKIITSLKESASNNEEIGMYWIENYNSCDWYNSRIETQALLIEAFSEIDKDRESIDAMKVWLIKNKQSKNWPTTKATTEAVYALLYQGTDWTSLKEKTKIKIGDEKILTQKLAKKDDEMDSGYLKIKFDATEINSKMGTITVDNKTKAPGFGGVYWQYFETLENIKSDSTKILSIDKKVFKKVKTNDRNQLIQFNDEAVKVGDLLTVRLTIRANTDIDFVHLKDLRASCLEPVDVISGYEWKDGIGYYKSTKDVATNFFFDTLKKGTYILEYDLRVTNIGVFNNGISTLQSMYSPEFGTHSVNTKINVTE